MYFRRMSIPRVFSAPPTAPFFALGAALAAAVFLTSAEAQAPVPARTPPAQSATPSPTQAPAPVSGRTSQDRTVPLDRVIAVVNDEALTQYDVNEQKRVVLGQMKTANVTPPSADVLEKQLLKVTISYR